MDLRPVTIFDRGLYCNTAEKNWQGQRRMRFLFCTVHFLVEWRRKNYGKPEESVPFVVFFFCFAFHRWGFGWAAQTMMSEQEALKNSSARNRGGVQRVEGKLRASVEKGDYYEAHQMYRTLFFRWVLKVCIIDGLAEKYHVLVSTGPALPDHSVCQPNSPV